MWCERMTDPGGPQGHKLSFLSTLLSQKVPEKSDVVLRCMISGHPKPEVTWYKNGQPVGECGLVSSYEFFAHQYIHVLHLSCCTRSDAAIYQISAKSCLGMICCSASIEVERLSENSQLPPELSDGRDTGWKREAERCGKESPGQSQQREYPYKEEENISPGAPAAADSSSPQLICFHSPQSLSTGDISASGPENLLVEETRQTAEAYDPNNAQDIFLNSIHTSENHNACCHETTPSTISRSLDCGPNDHEPHDGVLTSSHQNSKAQKYISFSLPLQEATACVYPAESTVANKPPSPQVSSEDSDSDYELCPEITLTYTEEFSDDDLEFLECSDVMTDYSNAVWQRSLQGTEHVFLLESDDEEMEFSECVLGGCEYFLSEMGCAPWVSGDTGPMDAPAGFAGYHSQAQEVGVSSSSSFRHSLSSQRTGMTLTVGAHQDGTATVTRQGRCPLLTASEAAENDCPGIQGETRDSHRAGEEFASNNLLTMDKEATEPGMKLSSWGSEESGTKQSLEITAEQSTERKALGSRRGVQKPVRGRRPGAKGKSKKLTLDDRLAPGTLSPPPWGSAECPLALSNQGESPQAKAGAPGWDSQVLAEECAISYPRQQHGKTLQCLAGSLHKEGDADLKEGTSVSNLRETNRTADQSGHPPVQIHETVRERISLSQMPAFSEPAGEESLFTGTTMSSLSNLGGIHKENASSTQYLEIESHPQGSQQGENQDRDGATPCGSWAQPQHELNPPEASDGNGSPDVLSVCLPLGTSAECRESETLSVGSPAPTNTTLTLGNVCSGSRSKEAACVVECFEASDQGTCYDTMDSPVGTSVDKYLLQDICSMDFELTEGQSKVCDLYSPDDKKLAALFQAQGGAPPQSTRDSSKGSNSALPPLFISTFTWTMSQMATKSARGGNLAEVENSTTTWSPTEQAGQDSLSPLDLGRTGEARPLSTENNSFVHFKEGDDERLRASVPVTTDMLACHSSVVKFPQEKPTTLMSSAECLQETKEVENTAVATVATKGHSVKYQAVSISEDSLTGCVENSLGASEENNLQFPSSVHVGHILSDSTSEYTKELFCPASTVPHVQGHVPLLERQDSCNNSSLQTGNQSRDNIQTVDREDSTCLEEDFQEKGSETEQRIQPERSPHQGSLLADDFQESLLSTSVVEDEVNLMPLEYSLANPEEERGHRSGLRTSVPVMVEKDCQALSNVSSLSEILQEESEDTVSEYWKSGKRLKIITLEASVSEIWPLTQVTEPGYKEAEASPIVPDRTLVLPNALKTDTALPQLDLSGLGASASRPQDDIGLALANHRETLEGSVPVHTTQWSSLSSKYLSQPRFLEPSVDPVDKKELWATDSSKSSKNEQKDNVNSLHQDQEDSQMSCAAFFTRFLTFPRILESSVDPIDGTDWMECPVAEKPGPFEPTPGTSREGRKSTSGNSGQTAKGQPAILQVPHPQDSGETIPDGNGVSQDQGDIEIEEAQQSQRSEGKAEVQAAIKQAPCPDEGVQRIPRAGSLSHLQNGRNRNSEEAGHGEKDEAESVSPPSPSTSCLAVMTHVPFGADAPNFTDQRHDRTENDLVESRNHQYVFSGSEKRGSAENEGGKYAPPSGGLAQWPPCSSPEGNVAHFPLSHRIEELKTEQAQAGKTEPFRSPGSPAMSVAFISRERESEKAPESLQDLGQKGSCVGSGKRPREKEKPSHVAAQMGKLPGARPVTAGSEDAKKKQGTLGSGHLAEGVKKKILSRVAALRQKLEEKENVRKNSSLLRKIPKLEKSLSCNDEKKDPEKAPGEREGKAPVLLKKIQAEMLPDHPGNVKLSCQFAEIHEDSTILWTKDSESIAQVQRSAGDNSAVSLAIVQASQKDQGLYYCCIKNSFGKMTAEFNLTAEVLKELSCHPNIKGCEEIEFSQLIFREDFLNDSYFGGCLRGQIATEALHFGEGVHRKAFRSTVMQGLMPVFQPGHACVLKVHNAVAHGTRNNDELIQRNYKLAAQECYVQNTARHYAKIYAAEAQPLEGFGEVPEIIPVFLIRRPESNVPYATVEEELPGEFVKYSIRDGKEINFSRRDSEAGQKCCTFQHWVYQRTSGCLLVTDMQGVGMKLTDVGIATLAKGYKGFKGNCSMTFIDQFKALHQCNKYCKMLGLKSLQNNNQKQKKPSIGKSKVHTNSATVKKPEAGTPAEKKS